MNLEKLKQLALIDQMGGQPQAEQQQQESKNRTAIALMQSLMQQEGESARLNAQQENIRGDQAYRAKNLAGDQAYRAQSLANQTGERTAANEARATSAKAEAERLKVASEQAATVKSQADTAAWYAQDRYTTDAAIRAENVRLQADQTKTAAENEAAKVTATALNNKRARAVEIYKLNLAAGMDPKTAATGSDDPELQAAGIAAQDVAVRREAAKYIAQVSSYPKTIRDQILNDAMKGGMHPDTRAVIDTHFNSQPTAPTAPNVSSEQSRPFSQQMLPQYRPDSTAPAYQRYGENAARYLFNNIVRPVGNIPNVGANMLSQLVAGRDVADYITDYPYIQPPQ